MGSITHEQTVCMGHSVVVQYGSYYPPSPSRTPKHQNQEQNVPRSFVTQARDFPLPFVRTLCNWILDLCSSFKLIYINICSLFSQCSYCQYPRIIFPILLNLTLKTPYCIVINYFLNIKNTSFYL